MKKKHTMVKCSCGCGATYPQGQGIPAPYKREGSNLRRLSDNVLFKAGDTIERIDELGLSYGTMIISSIDFYEGRSFSFLIRVTNKKGCANIENGRTAYENARNPNTFRYIKLIV
jgi:hypothetical protein